MATLALPDERPAGPTPAGKGMSPWQRWGLILLAPYALVFVIFVFDEFRRVGRRPLETGPYRFGRFVAQRADNQRRTGFVDQNAVGFVHQHEMRAALDGLFTARIEAGRGNFTE